MGKMHGFMSLSAAVGVALVLAGCTSAGGGDASSSSPVPASPTATALPTATGAPAPATAAPAAAPAAACPDDLTVELGADPSGTPGIYYLSFTNTGNDACDTVGFPDVTWAAPDGAAIGTQEHSDVYSRAGTTVSVAPGGQAYAWIHVVDASQSNGDCASDPTPVDGLNVTIAGSDMAHAVAFPARVCIDPEYMSGIQIGPFDSEQRSPSKGY